MLVQGWGRSIQHLRRVLMRRRIAMVQQPRVSISRPQTVQPRHRARQVISAHHQMCTMGIQGRAHSVHVVPMRRRVPAPVQQHLRGTMRPRVRAARPRQRRVIMQLPVRAVRPRVVGAQSIVQRVRHHVRLCQLGTTQPVATAAVMHVPVKQSVPRVRIVAMVLHITAQGGRMVAPQG